MIGVTSPEVAMFEAVLTLCLATGAATCRDTLIPGREADTRAACEAALAVDPPGPPPPGLTATGRAECRPAGPALDLTEAAPGLFLHEGAVALPDARNGGDVANLGIVVGKTSVAVIDTGGARWEGEALWRAVRGRTDLPVSHVILTHMHPDHVFGASVFAEAGAQVVGHARLGRALADRRASYLESLAADIGAGRALGSDIVTVDVAVEDAIRIDLGGRVLELRAWPMAHSATDLTVRDVNSGILFAGDLVFDRHAPSLDGSLRGWQRALDGLDAMDPAGVVPGHGGPLLEWPAGGAELRRYLDVLARDTRAALDAGERLGEVAGIAASEASQWALFDVYNPANATVAYTELEWE